MRWLFLLLLSLLCNFLPNLSAQTPEWSNPANALRPLLNNGGAASKTDATATRSSNPPCTYAINLLYPLPDSLWHNQRYQVCFEVTSFQGATASDALHALEINLGDDWEWLPDFELTQTPGYGCTEEGEWLWYHYWHSCIDYSRHGPAIAFDPFSGDEPCGYPDFFPTYYNNGPPGNNRGDVGFPCTTGYNSFYNSFCFTFATPNCGNSPDEITLSILPKSDGVSGNNFYGGCEGPATTFTFPMVTCCPVENGYVRNTIAACNGDSTGRITFDFPELALPNDAELIVYDESSGEVVYEAENVGPYFNYITNLPAGQYTLEASAEGCTASYSVQIEDAGVALDTDYEVGCGLGGLGQLTLLDTTFDPQGLEWWRDGEMIAADTTAISPQLAGNYSLSYRSGSCLSTSDTIFVDTFPVPEVAIQQQDLTFCAQQDSLLLSAEADSTVNWQWVSDCCTLPVGQGDSIWVDLDNYPSYNKIVAFVEGAYDCIYTDTVALFSIGEIATPSLDSNYCEGDTLQLTAQGDGSYLWSTGDTTATLEVVVAGTSTYSLTVTDSTGCTGVDSIQVASPFTQNTALTASDYQVCPGSAATLTGTGATVYAWSTGATTPSITVNVPPGGATYSLTFSDGTCSVTRSITVGTFDSIPDPQISCSPDYSRLLFEWEPTPGLTYEEEADGPAPTESGVDFVRFENLAPLTDIGLTLTVTDTNTGCTQTFEAQCQSLSCPEDWSIVPIDTICLDETTVPFPLAVNPPVDSALSVFTKWSGNGVIDTEGSFKPAAAGPGIHPIIFTFEQGSCFYADTAYATVHQPLPPAYIQCTANTNDVTISWPQLPQDTLYEINVLSGQTGEQLADTAYFFGGLAPQEEVELEITAYGLPPCGLHTVRKTCRAVSCEPEVLDASPDAVICASGNADLSVAELAGAAYSWSPMDELSCTDCHNPTARPESTTTYTVEVTDSLGCIYSQDITVWVEELPPAVLPEQVAFCPGQAFALCLPPGNSYLWFSPIGSITSGECLNLPNPSSAFAGNYTVLVELPNGCRFQERFRLTAASGEDCSSMALAPSPTAANVRLFPNPTTETLHIRSRHHIENVSLFNLQGQAVLEKQVGATDIDLEVSTLPSGMYVVRIKTVEGLYIRRAVRE